MFEPVNSNEMTDKNNSLLLITQDLVEKTSDDLSKSAVLDNPTENQVYQVLPNTVEIISNAVGDLQPQIFISCNDLQLNQGDSYPQNKLEVSSDLLLCI